MKAMTFIHAVLGSLGAAAVPVHRTEGGGAESPELVGPHHLAYRADGCDV